MQRVRGTDMHGIDGRLGKHGCQIGLGPLHSERRSQLFGGIAAAGTHGPDIDESQAPNRFQMNASHESRADDGSLQA